MKDKREMVMKKTKMYNIVKIDNSCKNSQSLPQFMKPNFYYVCEGKTGKKL